MKDLIKMFLLIVAIYSGATLAVNSNNCSNIIGALLCGVSCSLFVLIKDKKED